MQLYIHFRAIPTENKGHKLLAKMGWKEGEGLGKANAGIQQPVSRAEIAAFLWMSIHGKRLICHLLDDGHMTAVFTAFLHELV